jgi:hypothetical protein
VVNVECFHHLECKYTIVGSKDGADKDGISQVIAETTYP